MGTRICRRGLNLAYIITGIMCAIIIAGGASLAGAKQFQYDAHRKRDPFIPLIGQEKPAITRIEDATSIDDIKVEGIAIGAKGEKIAIINGEMIREKKKRGDLEVKKITGRSVTVSIGGQDYTVKLYEEGGRE